ncbi:hypothetical protein MML48_1g03707 [Holotrichia oblita]|uniref:Uncharacterized protein n=1 Tax=Holotrichia oblita TaxID=644536 RepID=A0ACB9TVK9_HOLOL|nr:hypothetical protein MML48_1g03707 [Holotrichia oblita]
MSKRNVTYTKPEVPAFLRAIKEQAGYTEGPTVDTKRQKLDSIEAEDFEDTLEEQPTVVVLEPGDLTADEAAEINKQRKEGQFKTHGFTDQTPADLSKPIVFRTKSKNRSEDDKAESVKSKRGLASQGSKSKKIKTSLLSFNQKEEDEEEEDD